MAVPAIVPPLVVCINCKVSVTATVVLALCTITCTITVVVAVTPVVDIDQFWPINLLMWLNQTIVPVDLVAMY